MKNSRTKKKGRTRSSPSPEFLALTSGGSYCWPAVVVLRISLCGSASEMYSPV